MREAAAGVIVIAFRHWHKRLLALDQERRSEPQRIREGYDVRATCLEPVGLVYLWPLSG